jgi:hypothetical protein
METGHGLLAAADLIWPMVEQGFAAARRARQNGRLCVELRLLRKAGLLPAGLVPFLEQAEATMREPFDIDPLFKYSPAFHLTSGYAIENFLKAVRVKRLTLTGASIKFGRASNDAIPTDHSYKEFARVELVTLSGDEAELLDRLSMFVTWAGRYPVTKKPEDMPATGTSTTAADHELVHRLAKRIGDAYESLG